MIPSMIKNTSPILAALKVAANSEASAVEFLESQRWGDAPACPRCGDANVYKMMSGENRNANFRWRCNGCKKMFTVRTNTVFEESRLPLRVWVFAFWRACASKKGCSALELSRQMEITHKSALFVLRRIRHGLGYDVNHDPKMLTGTVEVDETYIGGKPRYKKTTKRGRGTDKAPVLAMVQRGGDVRMQMMERVTSKDLADAIAANASVSARLITDEYNAYRTAGREFAGGHETVTHGINEYVRPGTDIHSNTVEGVFSLLKRGVMGTFHSISKKHLPNYLNEFEFRYNTRKVDDGKRVSEAIKRVDGKRLLYRESVDNPPYAYTPKLNEQPNAPFEEK